MWQHADARTADLKGPKGFALPGASRHYAPDRQAKVLRLAIEVWIEAKHRRIRGEVKLEIEALTETTHLDLDAQELTIGSVRDGEGNGLPFELDDGRLAIRLPRPLVPGERRVLEIAYAGEPRRGLYFIGPSAFDPARPVEVWTQGQDEDSRHWFPCFDYPNQKAPTELIAHVAPGQLALSNGVLVEERAAAGEHVWHYRQDIPHTTYLVTLVVGEYVAIEHPGARVPVVSYVHPRHLEAGKLTFSRTAEMVELFSKKIGVDYPFPRYAQICVADFIFGGMENTSATSLTELILFEAHDELDYRSNAESLVAHELAHQWWGDLVTCADWSHAWLNEGFATYFETVWQEHAENADEAAYQRLLDQEAYFQEPYRRPIVERTFDEPIDLFDRHQYEKGSAVLHMIRSALGDADFWRVLRRWGERHKGEVVESQDLRRTILDVTGKNLEAFFEHFVYSAGHPQLTLTSAWDAEDKVLTLNVEQTQRGDRVPEVFVFPVDIEVVTERGSKIHKVKVEQRKQAIRLAADDRPAYVVFDAGGNVLKQVDNRLPTQMLRALVERSKDVLAVIGAMRTLVKRGEPASIRTVMTALEKHTSAPIRVEAAKALKKALGAEVGLALSKAAVHDPDPRVRRAAIRALGQHDSEKERLTELLATRLDEETSDYAAADALRTIADLRASKARELLDRGLGKAGHNYVIRAAALEALAKLRDVTALPSVLAHTADSEHQRVREAATTTLGALGRFLPAESKERAEIRDRLVELLDDGWLRVRIRAAEGLKALHEKSALAELRDRTERELDGRARRALKLAERDIREASEGAEEIERLRDELKTLEHGHAKLLDRLEKLEARTKREPSEGAKAKKKAKKKAKAES